MQSRSSKMIWFIVAIATLSLASGAFSLPVTLTLQEGLYGYAGTLDNQISGQVDASTGLPTADQRWNQGGRDTIAVGNASATAGQNPQRTLIQFDLSKIPSGSNITQSNLVLNCTSNAADTTAYPVNVFRLLKPWLEGTAGNGTFVLDTASNWQAYDFPNAWSFPGAANASDSQIVPNAVQGVGACAAIGTPYMWDVTDTTNFWFNGINPNYGMLLVSDGESQRVTNRVIVSSENASTNLRPKLVVNYDAPVGADTTAPATPTNFIVGSVTSLSVVLNWSASNSEPDFAEYRLYRDGTKIADLPQNASSYTDSSVSASTTYQYVLTAVDLVGNESLPANVSATTPSSDTIPPNITITSHVPGTPIPVNSVIVNVRGTASDNVGVREVKWVNSTSSGGSFIGTASGTTNWNADVILSPGQNAVSFVGYDLSGNQSAQILTLSFNYTLPVGATGQGFGADTTGGENCGGGTPCPIILVTSLADDGTPGTLRYILQTQLAGNGNARVQFQVGGTISLNTNVVSGKLRVANIRNVSIDGTNAPWPGITIIHNQFELRNSENVIIRNIRIRDTNVNVNVPGLSIYLDNNRVWADHVSISHVSDESVGIYQGPRLVTVSYTLVANPSHPSGKAYFVGDSQSSPTQLTQFVTLHHNISTNSDERNPQVSGISTATGPILVDIRNNLFHNWTNYGSRLRDGATGNLANNVYVPRTTTANPIVIVSGSVGPTYSAGNQQCTKTGCTALNISGTVSTAVNTPSITITPINQLANTLFLNAGALPHDVYDTKAMLEIANDMGIVINVPIADAGLDFNANIGQDMTLSGTATAIGSATIQKLAWSGSAPGCTFNSPPATSLGSSFALRTVTLNCSTPGTYTGTITTTDSQGYSTSDEASVTYSQPPLPGLTAVTRVQVDPVRFNVSTSAYDVNLFWDTFCPTNPGTILYGTTTNYGFTVTGTITNSSTNTQMTTIRGLSANTAYHFIIENPPSGLGAACTG